MAVPGPSARIIFTKCVPALYADGSIGLEEVKELKDVADVGDEESMNRARGKFVRYQLRLAEPEDNLTAADLVVSARDFWLIDLPRIR